MSRYVTDTHALLWHLYADPRLSPTAKDIFIHADAGNNVILIPAIVLVEIIYLTEKKRIPLDAVQISLELLVSGAANYQIVPLDGMVVQSVQRIDCATVLELPDRVIAATALSLNLPLITRDANIGKAAGLNIIW